MTPTPIPITIITGFLGSGKTTLILKLLPQLPDTYRLALLKNEFGDVAVDSQLASSSAIAGVTELLNGCICCNLVGSLQDALDTLRTEQNPDRIVIETSGSAFPATLAIEVNRIARESRHYLLDGVITVIDVENWKGYDDTSVTAKIQAQYTDLLVLNKWEHVSERALDECIDRILDIELDVPTPRVKSEKGWVDKDLILGLDAKLAQTTPHGDHHHPDDHNTSQHEHDHEHSSEVGVLSITLKSSSQPNGIDLEKLEGLLTSAPKDEVYRIKALLYSLQAPTSSTGEDATPPKQRGIPERYVLNWAFGRWTFTASPVGSVYQDQEGSVAGAEEEPILRMTIVTALYDCEKWKKRVEGGEFIASERSPEETDMAVARVS